MYHFQRQIIEEAKKYSKPPLNGSTEAAMANLEPVDLLDGSQITEEMKPAVGQEFDVGGSKTDVGPKKMFYIAPRKGTSKMTLWYDPKEPFAIGDYNSFDVALKAALGRGKAGKVLALGKKIAEETELDETAATVVAHQRQSIGKEEQNKRTAEMLRKYRVPPSYITNFGNLRKRKASMPGSRIMWGADDRDLDVIPAKDIQSFQKDGWVIIEGVMTLGEDDFLIVREN